MNGHATPRVLGAPSNRPLLDALSAGRSVHGLVLVRRDGRTVLAQDARLSDWEDLLAQSYEEPIAPALLRLVGGEDG